MHKLWEKRFFLMGKKTLISFSRNVNEGFCYALKVWVLNLFYLRCEQMHLLKNKE